MRKDADIYDRAMDQTAALQAGRGKGTPCQPPIATRSCSRLLFRCQQGARISEPAFQPPTATAEWKRKWQEEAAYALLAPPIYASALFASFCQALSRHLVAETSIEARARTRAEEQSSGTHTWVRQLPRSKSKEVELRSRYRASGQHTSDEGAWLHVNAVSCTSVQPHEDPCFR